MEYRLTTPCTAQDLAPLKAGDTVLLSGVVYTARDQAHKRMIEALDKGEALPFDLTGSAIYYVGPTPERPGEVIGSAGPTTSGRMDAMSPRLLDLGNKIMIGKGKRDAAVKEAVVRNGAVYLAALGGAGALMAKSVETLEVIAWPAASTIHTVVHTYTHYPQGSPHFVPHCPTATIPCVKSFFRAFSLDCFRKI